jgi:phosphate uptake regulator/aminoglycoside phosphotransferase (APT) family kinase protein
LKSQIPQSIRHNLLFLIAEVSLQLSGLQNHLANCTATTGKTVTDRSGYILNLTWQIHNDSHDYIAKHKENKLDTLVFRAINAIASSLEHIAELCTDCVNSITALNDKTCLQIDKYQLLLESVMSACALIDKAMSASDTRLALKIARVEQQVKQTCDQLIAHYTIALKNKDKIEDLIAALFVARSVEHIGDALLNISEALISGNLGQAVNIDRYYSLSSSVKKFKQVKKQQTWGVKTIAQTRSGSHVSGITRPNNSNNIVAIFKDGKKRKLKEERESVDMWHQIYPGIAPKILLYNSHGESAALLIEHLEGMTFESLLLTETFALQQLALQQLCVTLKSVWQTTRRKKIAPAHFMQQLKQRMAEVYATHPEFKQQTSHLGNMTIPTFEQLIKQAEYCEKTLKPKFSVYIHGDFNSDNIIYDPATEKINFIDLHRSCYLDYVQDVSVFMVSNYRLQVLDQPLRKQVLALTLQFYQFVAEFARQNQDTDFELRLALGLARSFATSTRFILDKTLAQAMFMRARYLIEQVLTIIESSQPIDYRVPIQEIFVG